MLFCTPYRNDLCWEKKSYVIFLAPKLVTLPGLHTCWTSALPNPTDLKVLWCSIWLLSQSSWTNQHALGLLWTWTNKVQTQPPSQCIDRAQLLVNSGFNAAYCGFKTSDWGPQRPAREAGRASLLEPSLFKPDSWMACKRFSKCQTRVCVSCVYARICAQTLSSES